MGERLPCTQEVIGSIPFTSTKSVKKYILCLTVTIERVIVNVEKLEL